MRLRTFALALAIWVAGTMSAIAQTATVKGYVKSPQGPIVGAQVLFKDNETGRKYTLKTDKKGEFFSIGVSPGSYDVTVTQDGKTIYTANKFPVRLDKEVNELPIDLMPATGGETAQAPQPAPQQQQQQQPKLTEEQKKQIEEIQKKNAEINKYNEKVKQLNPLLQQAQAQMQAKNYDAAVQTMQQAEQIDQGQHALVYGQLGRALVADKKYAEAIDSLTKAIDMANSENDAKAKALVPAYYDNLGEAYGKSGKTAEAIEAYNKEAQADPTHAGMAYYNEGVVLINTGKPDEANAALDKAIAADPNNAEAYYQKGVNLLAKGTYDAKTNTTKYPPEAAQDLNKYLELKPDGPNAEQAKALIEQMGEKVTSSFKARKK